MVALDDVRLLDEVRDAEASFSDRRLHLLDRRRLGCSTVLTLSVSPNVASVNRHRWRPSSLNCSPGSRSIVKI